MDNIEYIKYEDLIIYYKIFDLEVYKPSEDSFLLLNNIKRYIKGKILDLGCGTGIIGLYSYKYDKDITFSDIDSIAIKISKLNFYINYINKNDNIENILKNIDNIDFPVKFIQSNLFQNIKEKFDSIFFNPPYLPYINYEDEKTSRWVSGGSFGYEIILEFLKDAKNHLNNEGNILMVFSSLSDPFIIIKNARDLGYKYELIDKEKFFFEELYLYRFYI